MKRLWVIWRGFSFFPVALENWLRGAQLGNRSNTVPGSCQVSCPSSHLKCFRYCICAFARGWDDAPMPWIKPRAAVKKNPQLGGLFACLLLMAEKLARLGNNCLHLSPARSKNCISAAAPFFFIEGGASFQLVRNSVDWAKNI